MIQSKQSFGFACLKEGLRGVVKGFHISCFLNPVMKTVN